MYVHSANQAHMFNCLKLIESMQMNVFRIHTFQKPKSNMNYLFARYTQSYLFHIFRVDLHGSQNINKLAATKKK